MKAFSFEGSGFEYFKIWIVNILLTIVTLGLYYPWAKVRNKRYMFANSMLEDKNFEYHATGKQLFIGYLIALGLFIAYVVISQVSPIGGLVVILLLFVAIPWIIWRSLKFNMRMTSFSNVRFGFDGLLGGAYMNYLLLPILFMLAIYAGPILAAVIGSSLGFIAVIIGLAFLALAFYLYALIKKRNTSYVMNGLRYGQGEFETSVETSEFSIILAKTLGLFIAMLVVFMILVGLLAMFTVGTGSIMESMGDPTAVATSGLFGIIGLVYLGVIILSMIISAYAYSRQRAYIFANSNLDRKINFVSTLEARPYAWILVTNLLGIIFTLGLAIPWAAVRKARLVLENTHVDTSEGFDEYITQQQEDQSALGEQIGDAFDVDVGIGF